MPLDRVEQTMDDLRKTRTDLETGASEAVLRLLLLGRGLEQRIGDSLAPFGLQTWEFDVLAALRRQGTPYRLACGELARQVLITCSGMTHRVSRLADRGLVARSRDADDRRTVFVELTGAGVGLVDEAMTYRVADSKALLADLDDAEMDQLLVLLRRLNQSLDGD